MSTVSTSKVGTSAFSHPKPFYLIFFIEFWERFGYYGMNGILALFFVKSLGFNQATTFSIMGAYGALLYGIISVGGYLGDSVLGTKRTMIYGAFMMAVGYFMLAFSNSETIFLALGVICIGGGIFKANPSNLLSKCYTKDDPRLHGAFTLYYMAINLGSFLSLTCAPYVASHFGWHNAFLMSAVGMTLGLINYFAMRKCVEGIDSEVGKRPINMGKFILIVVLSIVASFACAYLLHHVSVAHWILWIITSIVVIIFFKEVFLVKGITRNKMLAAFVLMIQAIIFFTLYQQMGTSLTFFAIKNVNPHLLGLTINPLSFQALNPFWIILGSPILAYYYNKKGNEEKGDISIAAKFAIGMTLCGISFILLYIAKFFASDSNIVSAWWIVLSYFFQSVGELLISALGVAMVAQMVPERIVGFIMGMWFLTSAISGVTGGIIASFTAQSSETVDAATTLEIYTSVFREIGIVTLIIAIIMWAFVPKLNQYIKENS